MKWLQQIAGVADELASIDDEETRTAVWREAWSNVTSTRSEGLSLLIFGAWIFGIRWLGDTISAWLGRFIPISRQVLQAYSSIVVCVSLVVLVLWSKRVRYQRAVRRALLARGIPVCLRCGYNLGGQIDRRCPECGTAAEGRARG